MLQQMALTKDFFDVEELVNVSVKGPKSGVWALNGALAILEPDGSVSIAGPVTEGPTGTPYEPAMGEYMACQVSTLPPASTANINAWLANGKQPYTTSRDEIATALHWFRSTATLASSYQFRNIVVGSPRPGLFNSLLVGTFRMNRSSTTITMSPKHRFATLGQTFPYGDKVGGNSDGTKTKTDVRDPFPDKKFGAPGWLQKTSALAFGATEFGDLIDSIYDALPRNRQYGRSYLDKLSRISSYWNEIDWGKALGNVIWNHYEDKLVGRAMDKISKQLRKTDIGGTNYKYGVTSGGGSSIYTGNITF